MAGLPKAARFARVRRPGYQEMLLLVFAAGVICGTAAVNLTYHQIQDQAGYFTGLLNRNLNLPGAERRQLFFWVFRQRSFQSLSAWILGLTVFSVPCFLALSAGLGLTAGVTLSVITCQKGLMGLPCYLATLFPHYLAYIPVWCILAKWAGEREGRLKLLPLLGLMALTLAGAAGEAYVNPELLKWLI